MLASLTPKELGKPSLILSQRKEKILYLSNSGPLDSSFPFRMLLDISMLRSKTNRKEKKRRYLNFSIDN